MRVWFDNVDFSSRSGPNSFGHRLAVGLSKLGHIVVGAHERPDVQLAFINATRTGDTPIVQRLDGVWFNSAQDWRAQNAPIMMTYDVASRVIVQSEFDKRLVEAFFGPRDNIIVIHNGADIEYIQSLDPLCVPTLEGVDRVWSCASSWRPHKRLAENIRYFKEHAGPKDVLVIAGANPDVAIADPRIFYTGDLDKETLLRLYRSTDNFLHLASTDHCPNVVVEARAAGCHIICASSGGTEEVAGLNSTVIEEDEWDFKPFKLYEPPSLDFNRKRQGKFDVDIDMGLISKKYESVLGSVA